MILILGGTTEARELAQALEGRAILSLAGTTRAPHTTPHRSGGFGGVEGLKNYIAEQNITRIVDATHPFAAQISANAVKAAGDTPLLRLTRPPWPARPDWQRVADLNAAARALPDGALVFLSVGSGSLAPFLRLPHHFVIRAIEPPKQTPPHAAVILQRPPFTTAGETALLRDHAITHLVTKNAGGDATRAKLDAAQMLGVQVIMVDRPPLPDALTVDSVAKALHWYEKEGSL